MEYATLGNTGLLVSKLCFGTMTFGDGRGIFKCISAVGQGGADELVKTSIDGGIKEMRSYPTEACEAEMSNLSSHRELAHVTFDP
jgi:hypothetical protein